MRQSRPSLFFPRVNNLSIVTTNAFCRFRLARAAFTTADGKVAKSTRCCPLGPSRCFAMMCSWFDGSFSLLLCHFRAPVCASILLTRLSARCLPSSWPGAASFRSCLKLPPGFLDTLEAGNCAGSRVLFFSVFSIGPCT